MWVILPAVSLAIVHIAGDNLAVVPDMAVITGAGIYLTTIVAYLIFGVLITGIAAWIGVKTGQELIVVVKRIYGCTGKKLMATAILSVCIPASALTGGYFSGLIIHNMTQAPHGYAAVLCVAFFSFMAAGWGAELLRISNYLALLLIPILAVLIADHSITLPIDSFSLHFSDIDWSLVLALIGYNAGGMRPALVVEASAYLARKKNKAIVLAMLAKVVEGIITLLLAHVVLVTAADGPMALSHAAGGRFGENGQFLFNLLVFCTFANTMVPAMAVNARQFGSLTGLSYKPAIGVAFAAVWLTSLLSWQILLAIMSVTGLLMTVFILLIAYRVHKMP